MEVEALEVLLWDPDPVRVVVGNVRDVRETGTGVKAVVAVVFGGAVSEQAVPPKHGIVAKVTEGQFTL